MTESSPTVALPNSTLPAQPRTRILRTLADAVRGVETDLTEAPLGRALLMLAIPMILEMVMESVFAMVDVYWVAHLGARAVATVGLTESMMMIIYSLAMGVSIGAMALVARRIGEKDADAAASVAVQGIWLGLIMALTIGVAGVLFAPRLLALMGADAEVVRDGSSFTRVMLGGNATVFLLFLINSVFRGAGDAAQAMRVLWLGNALNIVLGPLFIFGIGPFPELGVTGAAVGTTLGRGIAVLYQLWVLRQGTGKLVVTRAHVRVQPRLMASVFKLSLSATGQMLISMTSYIALMRILSGFGSATLAGYTIGFRIFMFAILPAFGLANAAATLVGQNLGAQRPERAEASVWRASNVSAGFLCTVGVGFLLGAPWLVSLFTHEPEVARHAVSYLRIVSLGFPFYGYGMVVSQSFNGAGDTRTPTLINLLVFWALQIPLAWGLSHYLTLGVESIFATLAFSFSVFAVVSVLAFRRGTWKRVKV